MLSTFASAFIDDDLFEISLGGNKQDIDAIELYLDLPIAARPGLSHFFDQDFYLQLYPDVAQAQVDPLAHFMHWGVREGRAPHPLIDLAYIRQADVAILSAEPSIDELYAVLSGDLADPSPFFSRAFYRRQLGSTLPPRGGLLLDFLQSGILRGLKPHPSLDPIAHYRRLENKTFDVRSALRHFVLNRGPQDTADFEPATEQQALDLQRTRARYLLPIHLQQPISFEHAAPPDIGVVMLVRNDAMDAVAALASLRDGYAGAIELVVVVLGTADDAREMARYVVGARWLVFERSADTLAARNAGLQCITAESVLLLGEDVELAPGAIGRALHRLSSDALIGAVGGKLVRPHGRLREAGCIIWRGGETTAYLRDRTPLVPEANFVRDVDFCSSDFLLLRMAVLGNRAVFDTAFAQGALADADLGLRIWAAGYRVVYDPQVVLQCLALDEQADQKGDRAEQDLFCHKHADSLAGRHEAAEPREAFARARDAVRSRVLFIDDQIPLRRIGSGFVRSNDIVQVMAAGGHFVTVYPISPGVSGSMTDFPDTVEVMHDQGLETLAAFLDARDGYYDTIWITRTHNLDRVRPILARCGDRIGKARIILDTEAVVALRDAQRASLSATAVAQPDISQALITEFANADICHRIVTTSAMEADRLRELGFRNVAMLGHLRALSLTARSWKDRTGILFVGAIHGRESPNYDSLLWFADQILPYIDQELDWETRLTVVGHVGRGVDMAELRRNSRVTLLGSVADLAPIYDAHRVFVAPTRYAGGIPYKVHEAASYGVPVVATTLLCEQLGWESGRQVLAADPSDPEGFARHVVALYRSEELWTDIRCGAARAVQQQCSRQVYETTLNGLLAAEGPAQPQQQGDAAPGKGSRPKLVRY